MFQELFEIHETISTIDSPWAIQLEVSYIPKDALRRFDPSNNRHPHNDREPGEKLHISQHDADWIIRAIFYAERGITVTGPDPKTLIDPVSPADLRWAVSEILQNWFRHFLDDPAPLQSRGYQSYTVGLPRTDGDKFHVPTGLGGEGGEQNVQQTRVLSRGG